MVKKMPLGEPASTRRTGTDTHLASTLRSLIVHAPEHGRTPIRGVANKPAVAAVAFEVFSDLQPLWRIVQARDGPGIPAHP